MNLPRSLCAALLIVGAANAASVQDTGCLHPVVLVSILDGNGLPVTGLQPADFRVQIGGKQVGIVRASENHPRRRVVVLLDASHAIRGSNNGKWKLALQIAIDVFVKTPPDTQLALVIFSRKIDRIVNFDAGRSAALALLGNLRTGSEVFDAEGNGAHFLDSILQGLELFRDHQCGDVIYAITSGYDSGSKTSLHDVDRALTSARVRAFLSVLVSSPSPRSGIDILP